MNDRARNLLVGLTSLTALIGLAVLMMAFGYVPGIFEDTYPIRVALPQAYGLSEGSRVEVNGIDIGRVDIIELQVPASRGVIVTAAIESDVALPEGTHAIVTSPLIGGGGTMSLIVNGGTEARSLARDGTAVIAGRSGSLTDSLTSELSATLEGPFADFSRIANSFEEVSTDIRAAAQNLNGLIEPRGVEAVDAGEAAGNAATVLARADQRLAQMQRTLDHLESTLGDPKFQEDLRVTAANIRNVSDKASTMMDELDGTLDESINALRNRYIALADDMSGAVASMRGMLDDTRGGSGTIGQLLTNDRLYKNLNDTAERASQTMDEVRLLIEKWKAEGLPVHF